MRKDLKYRFRSSLLILWIACFQMASAKPINTVISGKVFNAGSQSVALYKVDNGAAIRVGFRWPEKDGSFSFNFPLEKESIFFIAKNTPHPDNLRFALYVKPGNKIELQLYSDTRSIDYDSCKIKTANQETLLLQQWVDLFNPVCKVGHFPAKRDSFFSLYSQLQSKAAAFSNSIRTSNKYFNGLMRQKVDVDMDFAGAAAFFYFTERMNSGHDTSMAHRSFYERFLQQRKYCDASLLNTDHGMGLLKYYTSLYRFFQVAGSKEFFDPSISSDIKLICNDTLKGALVIDHMRSIVSYEAMVTEVVPYEKYFLQSGLLEEYKRKKDELLPFAKGADAFNFSLPNASDKSISLSDFKGKVVVVDMWAMWCAPCLAEKPYFQKMEDAFKNNNEIIFVSVSVDGDAKRDLWKKFIAKKAWKGIELLSNYDESLMKYYRIEGIPRFMIFDKQGKIVTVDAPRPSNPEFKKIIEQTLKTSERAINP